MVESGCPHWPHHACFALEIGPVTGVSHWPAPSRVINMVNHCVTKTAQRPNPTQTLISSGRC